MLWVGIKFDIWIKMHSLNVLKIVSALTKLNNL